LRKTILAALIILAAPLFAVESLESLIARIAGEIDATVGVAALHVESGRRVSLRGDEPFPMGSVNKLPIAIAFLRQVDLGKVSLSREVTIQPAQFASGHSPLRDSARGKAVTLTLNRALDLMLGQSDSTASDLLERLAGVEGVEDTTTPDAMLAVLERFYARKDGLSKSSHDLAMKIMTRTPAGEHRIRAGAPADASVAHKTGTTRGLLNDVGIITSPNGKNHLLLAVFTKGGREATTTQRERTISTITREIYQGLIGTKTKTR